MSSNNNIYNNRFTKAPIEHHKASSWIQPNKHLTTFNTGDIVPIYCNEILSGDNVQMQINRAFVRMTTPIYPVMDNAYLDIMYFYVPYRILYDKYPEFLGAKEDGYGIQENEYFLPSVYNIEYDSHDIGSYMGAPVGVEIKKDDAIQTLWFKAYAKIYNDWFRNENLIEPFDVKKTYENLNYSTAVLSDVEKLQYGKGIAKASKLKDLFTSALPFVQRGPSVEFNFNTEVPVLPTNNQDLISSNKEKILNILEQEKKQSGLNTRSAFTRLDRAYYDNINNKFGFNNVNKNVFMGNDYEGNINLMSRPGDLVDNVVLANYGSGTNSINPMFLTNLTVNPDFGFSINELRTAVQMQRFYEQLARGGGNRYNEIMHSLFGVRISDNTVQRPVLLARRRFDINMSQVVQTSSSDNVSPQGNTSGISATLCNNDNAFNTSFEEPGVLMGLVVVRTAHTYIQRLPKELSKKRKFDFYYPVFQALGEQAVLNKEIYYSGDSEVDNKVFGYQEAWYEYRFKPSYCSGKFHDTQSSGAYESWTYADYFAETPILNKDFIQENGSNLARTLAVPGEDHFIIDFYVAPKMTRLMPVYSIPGLMDHF